MAAKKQQAFEDQLKRLEEIVRLLEGGQLPLEESLKVFEEGVKLSRACHDRLADAERKVELLLQDTQGGLATEPFEDTALTEEDLEDIDTDRE